MNKRDVIDAILAGKSHDAVGKIGSATAPVNFALIKYWGKRDVVLNLPVTSSLSISLPQFGAYTTISYAERSKLVLNDKEIASNDAVFQRLFDFLNLFPRPKGTFLSVNSHSSIPVGAGLASSASGFAAAVKALDDLNDWQLDDRSLSILARMGSGSACRSIFSGFSEWHAGIRDDGMDSYAEPLPYTIPDLSIGLLILSAKKKKIGSTEGMKQTAETSFLYKSWPQKVDADLKNMQSALKAGDFDCLGRIAESNALGMHATMIDTWPPVIYWQPVTVECIHKIHEARAHGLPLYFTMDAGPNIKLLFLRQYTDEVTTLFPDVHITHAHE